MSRKSSTMKFFWNSLNSFEYDDTTGQSLVVHIVVSVLPPKDGHNDCESRFSDAIDIIHYFWTLQGLEIQNGVRNDPTL